MEDDLICQLGHSAPKIVRWLDKKKSTPGQNWDEGEDNNLSWMACRWAQRMKLYEG